MNFFSLFSTFNCRILHFTTRRTCAKSFAIFDCTDCEIITFEVERKVFFHCAWQGQQTLTARGAIFFNYTILGFYTIVMHIKLGTCVPSLEVDDEWNILKFTMHWRGVQKISITLAKLVEFLVISIFHETKIRMVDMKVQVYSKFSKNKIPKKVKSPNSMRNGRFHTSKCRGKLEKMGALCTHSPKTSRPLLHVRAC
jgi:hypothetical protein